MPSPPSQPKVAVIAGFGTGISSAVADAFAKRGFKLALLARTQSRLDAAVAKYKELPNQAKGYATDLSDGKQVEAVIARIRQELGSISVVVWNPYGKPGSVLESGPEAFGAELHLNVLSLHTALQASLEDLKANKGAFLVTQGGLALDVDVMSDLATSWGAATLAVAKAAQHKYVQLAHRELKPLGVYVAEFMVLGIVKDTPFDADHTATLTAEMIASVFLKAFDERTQIKYDISPP